MQVNTNNQVGDIVQVTLEGREYEGRVETIQNAGAIVMVGVSVDDRNADKERSLVTVALVR